MRTQPFCSIFCPFFFLLKSDPGYHIIISYHIHWSALLVSLLFVTYPLLLYLYTLLKSLFPQYLYISIPLPQCQCQCQCQCVSVPLNLAILSVLYMLNALHDSCYESTEPYTFCFLWYLFFFFLYKPPIKLILILILILILPFRS
jgi:hypothetical protein